MTTVTTSLATLADLMEVEGKAELIGGRIVPIMPSGFWPGKVARRITRSLEDFAALTGLGEPIADNVGYGFVQALPSGRQSFSPDSSFFIGTLPGNRMRFIQGYPVFAVEVRSENDYGPAKDREYEEKRKDYFFIGTQVVWDVDPIAETVTVYRLPDPSIPVAFHRGETADAEPALPGWRLRLDDIFG
jgi:Uma2 family endonuclease